MCGFIYSSLYLYYILLVGTYWWSYSGASYMFSCGVFYGFYSGASYMGPCIMSLNESFKYLSSGVFNYKLSKCSPNIKYNESVS